MRAGDQAADIGELEGQDGQTADDEGQPRQGAADGQEQEGIDRAGRQEGVEMGQARREPRHEEPQVQQGWRRPSRAVGQAHAKRQDHQRRDAEHRQAVVAHVLGLEDPEDRARRRGGRERPPLRRQGRARPEREEGDGAGAEERAQAAQRRLGEAEDEAPGVEDQVIGRRMGVGEGAAEHLAEAAMMIRDIEAEQLVGPIAADPEAGEGQDGAHDRQHRERPAGDDPAHPGGVGRLRHSRVRGEVHAPEQSPGLGLRRTACGSSASRPVRRRPNSPAGSSKAWRL